MTKLESLISGVKYWYYDRQFTKVYAESRAVNKELALRMEALNGTTCNQYTDNFITFLKRRIETLKARKNKIDTKFTALMQKF